MTSTQDKLREQVESARSRLGDTVEELAAKADVKSRAQQKAAGVRHAVEAKTPEPVRTAARRAARTGRRRPLPTAMTATALALALAVLILRRRNHGS